MKKLNVLKIPRDLVTMRKKQLILSGDEVIYCGKVPRTLFKGQDNISLRRRKIKKVVRYIKYWG